MNDDLQADLITALKSGDPGAFSRLYDDYSPVIFGLILRIVQDNKAAESLFQEAFIKIRDKIHLYSPAKGRFPTWVINIARNTALDFTKSLNAKQVKDNMSNNFSHNADDSFVLQATNSEDPPMNVNILEQPLKIIELMYFEGCSQNEISEKYNISIGTVKTLTRVAMQKLRAVYF